MRLFLAFTLIPLVEIYLLIRLGSEIGVIATVCIVLITALTGASLARLEGWHTLRRIQTALAQGTVPAEEMVDAALIFAAGLLLITPGFLTDAVGFALLIPPARRVTKRWLWRRLSEMASRGDFSVTVSHFDDW